MVVTPERTVLDQAAEFVALPLYDGELGVAPGRAPLVGRLGYGELRVRAGGRARRFFIDGGFVQVRDDVVTVLTSRAMPTEEIDAATPQRELAAARALVARSPDEQAEKQRAVARAGGLVRLASTSAN
jgi:F-type H+-transporting ATPase subunit epsilon